MKRINYESVQGMHTGVSVDEAILSSADHGSRLPCS